MREGKNSLYYVDAEYNGAQTDMPFSYCVIFTLIRKQNNVSDNNQGMAFAFDVTTGDLKFKCFGGTTGDRNYPWKTISLT